MKKNAGFIALVTIALAFLGVTSIPLGKGPSNESGAGRADEAKKPPKGSGVKSTESFDACEEIGHRLESFITRPAGQDWALPRACYTSGQVPPNLPAATAFPDLRFLIATVPNPISTHLPLMFDRFIEVIQRAARDENYAYNSSWFPWDETEKYSSFSDQRAEEEMLEIQQSQPGVMTFRRAPGKPGASTYGSGLIVFVISEQPTRGVDTTEFENALAWMESLGALDLKRRLRVLGPTFSGSLPSLKLALSSRRLAPFDAQGSIDIYSGSVSSADNYDWFYRFIEGSNLGSFRTANESDSRMLNLFCTFIKRQGYELDRVAILSEDETAFGADPQSEPCFVEEEAENNGKKPIPASGAGDSEKPKMPLHLAYPRDIATLRSAYQQQSILASSKAQPAGSSSSTSLRGDLSEPASSEHDTVRSYGGQLTPLAQESSLVAITDILRSNKIQFVVLRSTNTLDQIFLGQFLRRVYPEARVVIDGADLLFRRGGEGSSLRGVLTLSSYPLLTWQQDWTPSMQTAESHTFPMFGQDVAEGEYIAARTLLGPSPALISNYAPPSWTLPDKRSDNYESPATWISVVGHHQFWPVAVLNETTLDLDSDAARRNRPQSLLQKKEVFSNGNPSPLGIQGGLQFVLIAGLVWSLLHLAWCQNGCVTPSTSLFKLAYFAPIQHKQHAALIAMGSLFPVLAAVITAFSTGLMTWSLSPFARNLEIAWVIGILLAALGAFQGNYGLATVAASPQPENRQAADWHQKVGAVAFGCFALFVLLYLYMTYFSGQFTIANKIPVYWRSAHLLSGVSPLLPQVLLLAGLYMWFWFGLRGLALFGDDRPLLPRNEDLPAMDDLPHTSFWPMFSREGAGDHIEEAAIPLGSRHLSALAAAMVAAFCLFWVSLEDIAVRTLGERAFGITIFAWLVLCMALVLADSIQLWIIWKRLHCLLIYLDRLPLRRTLAGLKGLSWGSVWDVSGNTLGERYRLISRQFESLRHLSNQLAAWVPEKTSPAKQTGELARKQRAIQQLEHCQTVFHHFAEWYVKLKDEPIADLRPMCNFQNEIAKTAAVIVKEILLPAWQSETQSLIIQRSSTPGKDKDKDKDDDAGTTPHFDTKNVPPHVLAAEEFVVLPYLGFIQNILGRIRSIVLGSLFLFVATTFAVASYPFDPLPRLGGAFLVVFLITGGAVIIVYAQMNRDTTLSHITNTNPGELGSQFWVQLITFGIGPLLGLLTTLFPSITDFVTSWLQPNVQALK